jgi:hypothetical protein
MFRIQIQKRRKCFVQIPINPEPQLVVLLFATCSLNLLVDGPRAMRLGIVAIGTQRRSGRGTLTT